jgi:hypothetical protein
VTWSQSRESHTSCFPIGPVVRGEVLCDFRVGKICFELLLRITGQLVVPLHCPRGIGDLVVAADTSGLACDERFP